MISAMRGEKPKRRVAVKILRVSFDEKRNLYDIKGVGFEFQLVANSIGDEGLRYYSWEPEFAKIYGEDVYLGASIEVGTCAGRPSCDLIETLVQKEFSQLIFLLKKERQSVRTSAKNYPAGKSKGEK